MMFDHMSVTWGVDETFSMNPDSGYVIDNITIQNTVIAQGLDRLGHSAGGLMTLGEGSRFSIIKSLFADNVTRNPKVRGENEFINNVIYGYETAGYIMGDTVNMNSRANAIGNYFIEAPSTAVRRSPRARRSSRSTGPTTGSTATATASSTAAGSRRIRGRRSPPPPSPFPPPPR